MLLIRRRIQDAGASVVLWLDYLVYLIFNLHKFKAIPRKIERILVVETRNIGDIIVATPVLRTLREKFPQARIDILVKERWKEVLRGNKQLNNIIPWDNNYKSIPRLLKETRYDLGILLHIGSFRLSNALRESKIKYRIGCAKEGMLTGKGFFLHKKIVPRIRWRHKIEDNLDVIRSVGIIPLNKELEIHASKEDEQTINKELLKNKVLSNHFKVCMHANSQHASQRWYKDRFVQVANKLIKKYNAKIIFTGLEQDKPYIENILRKVKYPHECVNFAGKTSFGELVVAIKSMNLIISIDTSIVHVASALQKPIIALFGPTVPTFWGPRSEKSITLWKNKVCTGCRYNTCVITRHDCMMNIQVEDVLNAVEEMLKK